MSKFVLFLLCLSSLAVIGCSKDPGGDEVKSAVIPKLGLQAELPDGITFMEGPAALGGGQTLTGPNVSMVIANAEPDYPKTIDEAKQHASLFDPTNLKAEKLADGYLVTYENTGSMGKNYFLDGRREIGGKVYRCTIAGSTPEQQARGKAICKSLHQ